ncbi:Sodium/hydrogen exchanger family protein [Thiohalomonas denitrificans]|uniref:Sodium/hydrogen exchanger family protein n=1 Tax=Thiohalomonas denitrificans TaxID=415747 RepID=A0A1G5Q3Q2_9GAMM|nr:Sodium/hydrogen exchanger family protein [Thiohalomonas denitrificans]
MGIWREAGTLDTTHGRLLLDIAELDDIVGIILMGLLLSVLPILLGNTNNGDLWGTVGSGALLFFIKFFLFAVGCLLFARYLEKRLTSWSARFEPDTGLMLLVLGFGFVIAAVAGWLGFSLAIGALFAGLVFSRDPKAIQTEASFNDLYTFFSPFFFIGIGLDINPAALTGGLQLGLVLLLAAIAGKLLGAGLLAWPFLSGTGAILIGISMVPRAEIAMVIMHHGKAIGPEVVPDSLYAGMVLVTAATSLLAPLALRPLIGRWRRHL